MRRSFLLALPVSLALAAQAPAPPVASPAPQAAAPAPAPGPFLVRGVARDAKGAPVAGAEAFLLRAAADEQPLARATADAEGFFLLETRERGIFRLVVTGRAHKGVETLVLLTDAKPQDFTVRLARFRFLEGTPYRVTGRLAGKPLPQDAGLTKQADGTWAWEAPAQPGETWVGTLRGGDGAILPSRLDGTRLAGNGLLGVVQAQDGRIRILADPKAYITEAEEGTVSADTEGPEVRVIFRALEEAQRLTAPYLLALRDWSRNPGSGRPDAAPTLKALREATQKATAITRPIFMLNEASVTEFSGQPMPKDLAQDIVTTVGSASPIWSLFPSLPARLAKVLEPEAGRKFLAEVAARSGDRAVQRDVRMDALEAALERGDLKEAAELHASLSEAWGGHPRFQKALKALDPAARKAPAQKP
jgi:hypothetical protein